MPKVLVVDDSQTELTNLCAILDGAGWQTVTAVNGSDAVIRAQKDCPDVILLDVVMPDMDGFEACRQLQASAETKNIPVIFVTSKNQRADHLWAKMQGAKCLVGKPYQPEEILSAIRSVS